jgi:intracellular septation protein
MSETKNGQHPGSPPQEPSLTKLLIDLGPLLVFLISYWQFGLRSATGVLVVVTLLSLVISRVLLGKISASLWVTAVLVTVFGSLTFLLDDPRFIKMKPTAVYLIFAAALTYGLLTGRQFLKLLLGEAIDISDTGWRLLTQRWIGLFLSLAVLNEFIWRTMSESTWVNFKVFGILPLTMIFAVIQLPLINRHKNNQ